MNHADVIVVGLGAMGSATAYQLAQRGASVIGVDQYSPPHNMGSTHGESRVTRQATAEGAEYVPLVKRSHELWREIEAQTDGEIFTQCGVLMVEQDSAKGALHGVGNWLDATIELADQFSIEHKLLKGDEAHERYPQFNFEGECRAYFEPVGGIARPAPAVSSQLQLAQQLGAEIVFNSEVIELTSTDENCTVRTLDATYHADKVVLSAGAWIPNFLNAPELHSRFTIYRQALHWFSVNDAFVDMVSPRDCPVYMWSFDNGPLDFFYGFPELGGLGNGMKVATEQFATPTTAEDVDRSTTEEEAFAMFDRCLENRLLAITRKPVRSISCLYTVTPDSGFVIDEHPELANVTIVSPCSGHGFKHSAAIGEAVAEQVLNGASAIDLSPFSIARLLPTTQATPMRSRRDI